jgi:signal transduction histidine kinase/DNA-binding response OmpR family regulator
MDPITLAVEAAFAVVFAWSLVTWIRRRDPISREVTVVFSGLGSLFLLAIVRQVLGTIPEPLSRAFVALFLAQPVFTLRLVAQVRSLPRWVLPAAYLAYAITTVPFAALGAAAPRAVLLGAAATFVVVEVAAGGLLVASARARVGSARLRLGLAALATFALASTIVVASAGTAGSGSGGGSTDLSRILAILAGAAYLVAFLPPKPLRNLWQGVTAYDGIRELLTVGGVGVGEVWTRFAGMARSATGASAAAVITTDADHRLLAQVGLPEDQIDAAQAMSRRQDLGAVSDDVIVDLAPGGESVPTLDPDLAERVGRFVRVVPLGKGPGDPVLLLWSDHRALFAADDRQLLSALGAQAAVIAEGEDMRADQERLSMQLSATVDALQRASQAKSDFLASMSHELRTPLNAILGFSELMKSEPADETGQIAVPAEWIDHVQRGGQHLLALVNDVLDLAKIEAGRLELDPTSFEVLPAVTESVAGLRPLAERKNQTVDVDVERELGLVADRGRFRQVLYNLLSNAIKYTPANGRITISGRLDGGDLRLAVADTGIGISADDLGRVFDEFQQVGRREGHSDGTGLGLALTRRLVEAHGGRISVESEPDVGSTFTVILPAGAAAAQDLATEDDAPSAAAAPSTAGDVLIVEDDPGAARLLRAYLEPEGHQVRIAADGEAALAEARRAVPAAIVLDVLLPGIDGWDVLRQLKADATLRDVPVVIVTVIDEREVGLALGAADYLVKPVSRSALLAALDRFLAPPAAPARMPRILAVDDDPTALDVIDAVLRPAGFDLIRADGGREAIAMARDTAMDLVICDLVMPDLDGFDVVAALKADPTTQGVPILIVTAHDLTEADKARLNGRVLGVVSKGTGASAGLRDWLATVLGGHGPNGHLASANGQP